MELRGRALAIEELEDLVRGLVVQRAADVGVDVREGEVRLLLGERVEGDALGEDLADDLVVALDLRPLRLSQPTNPSRGATRKFCRGNLSA